MKIIAPSVSVLWVTKEPERQIELAGRTCYKSEDKMTLTSAREFCRRMVSSGHHAMLEHAGASFHITCDRGITHEIVRHRVASYAQESTRYCNYSTGKFHGEISVVCPPGLSDEEYIMWKGACECAEKTYLALIDRGISPQIARSVLPTCLKAELVMTCNFREWRHFINLRYSPKAHPQIRPITLEIWKQLMGYAPSVFSDLITDPEVIQSKGLEAQAV